MIGRAITPSPHLLSSHDIGDGKATMIASALRADIVRLTFNLSNGAFEREPLARCSLVVQRLASGLRLGSNDDVLSSMRALAGLLERSQRDASPECLVYRAFAEHLVAELGLPSADRDRVEAALDALDARVDDPQQIVPLRQALRTFVDHFHRFLDEVSRAARRPAGLAASAA